MHKAVAAPELSGTSNQAAEVHIDWMERLRPYLYVAPAMLFFALFFFFPIGYVIYLSFFDWSLLNLEEMEWVGLGNFTALMAEEDFWQVFGNTLIYTVVTVGLGILLSFMLALWLNRKAKVFGIVQAAVFSPHIVSLVSIAMLWMWLMDPQYGLLNAILEMVGLPGYSWLSDTKSAMVSLILVSIWKGVGYNTLVFIAGMQSIPKDIYEAADLDHSPWWRTLTRITIPMLSPTMFFLLVINTVSSFQVFDTIYIMTQGGPVNSTNMLVFYIYEQGMDFYNGGAASAASVILLAMVGFLTWLHFRLMEKRVHYR
ncbi:carbohydrate ABC transporter permease [Brevibacillus centrosporus]|uniref:Carbohydrate ABC transporter membrane protein 1, CUT1 family n=1 Tax=Brevibacillus centrosporus TaxID=54910 RepID=A0A1I3UY61_9BACL|nr:sugar ABC transporter permease [Brevibacillus centrosporus]MED4907291.1 sugar ABC transporter permease [Brevibacillus centrosporus]SFJ88324.1 carbohydrate ABC transporter membrane protein 1, CUT1 family [Brevibacillus centrosporus]